MGYEDQATKILRENNRLLGVMCTNAAAAAEAEAVNDLAVYQTVSVTTAVDGSIPTGATAYSIRNLGVGDNTGQTSFTVNGQAINAAILEVGDSLNSGTFAAIPYVTNGNTLFIQYTVKT